MAVIRVKGKNQEPVFRSKAPKETASIKRVVSTKEIDAKLEPRGRGRPAGELTVPVTLRLPPGVLERLDVEAGRLGMTRTALVRRYLEEGLVK